MCDTRQLKVPYTSALTIGNGSTIWSLCEYRKESIKMIWVLFDLRAGKLWTRKEADKKRDLWSCGVSPNKSKCLGVFSKHLVLPLTNQKWLVWTIRSNPDAKEVGEGHVLSLNLQMHCKMDQASSSQVYQRYIHPGCQRLEARNLSFVQIKAYLNWGMLFLFIK